MTQTSNSRNALIVGAGIAGLSAASALKKAGWNPVVIERSAHRRRGGYFIAMFGCGRIAAERLQMKGIRNRIAVAFDWLWSWLTRQRNIRLIVQRKDRGEPQLAAGQPPPKAL